MRSMTGYGSGEASLGAGQVTLELRALNHRFVEVRVRLPPELGDFGSFLEQVVRERLDRGRIDVAVRLTSAALPPARFSRERARALYGALTELRDELAPGTELSLATLAGFSELLLEPALADVEAIRRALLQALEGALAQLCAMRQAEGAALGRELEDRLAQARALSRSI
ncbi:MAG TPA: YicC/YloC family endoribonuclease, partial [Polyangiaceae bacterium]